MALIRVIFLILCACTVVALMPNEVKLDKRCASLDDISERCQDGETLPEDQKARLVLETACCHLHYDIHPDHLADSGMHSCCSEVVNKTYNLNDTDAVQWCISAHKYRKGMSDGIALAFHAAGTNIDWICFSSAVPSLSRMLKEVRAILDPFKAYLEPMKDLLDAARCGSESKDPRVWIDACLRQNSWAYWSYDWMDWIIGAVVAYVVVTSCLHLWALTPALNSVKHDLRTACQGAATFVTLATPVVVKAYGYSYMLAGLCLVSVAAVFIYVFTKRWPHTTTTSAKSATKPKAAPKSTTSRASPATSASKSASNAYFEREKDVLSAFD